MRTVFLKSSLLKYKKRSQIMKIRKNIWPKTLSDTAACLFLSVCIPVIYWFEMFVVVPEILDQNSIFYYIQFVFGIFILFNIVSNMLAIMVYNTSIIDQSIIPPADASPRVWKFCSVCEAITPPRSWHCNTCRVCILKRDHHCVFTGCCIGHSNHRYYFYLVFYLFIGTLYSCYFNNIFIWIIHSDIFTTSLTIVKIVFPLAMFMYDATTGQYYLLLYLITTVGCLFTGFLLFYHTRLILNGRVVHEVANQFDLGTKNNIKMVLGERWYLTWISPFIKSDLIHDGIHWQTVLQESTKNL